MQQSPNYPDSAIAPELPKVVDRLKKKPPKPTLRRTDASAEHRRQSFPSTFPNPQPNVFEQINTTSGDINFRASSIAQTPFQKNYFLH
jgi:hypothetical protein